METEKRQQKKYCYLEEKPLSEREKQIIKHISEGKSNTKIAKILGISKNTVKLYTIKIYEKLCVEDRVQAAVKAVKMGIIE